MLHVRVLLGPTAQDQELNRLLTVNLPEVLRNEFETSATPIIVEGRYIAHKGGSGIEPPMRMSPQIDVAVLITAYGPIIRSVTSSEWQMKSARVNAVLSQVLPPKFHLLVAIEPSPGGCAV